MHTAFFIFATLMILSAIGVLLLRNPIHAALALTFNLFMVADVFALLGAKFLAIAQIIVYAGAIMVLILFVLMLLNIRQEERKHLRPFWAIVSAIACAAFIIMVLPTINGFFKEQAMGFVGTRAMDSSLSAVGRSIFGKFVFIFEAVSLLIVSAMAGAIMLAKKRSHIEKDLILEKKTKEL